jgi:lipid kinase YegS
MVAFFILNGKKCGIPEVDAALERMRREGWKIVLRTTKEGADLSALVQEAADVGAERIVAGGGDGTLNAVAHAMLLLAPADRLPIGVVPLGTANDFARACAIPASPLSALELALTGSAAPVDVIKANERGCVNVATAGFGARVTAETPAELKNFLGGGAYTLMGLVKVLGFKPFPGGIRAPGLCTTEELILGAVCNGRQAGGGQVLAPAALLNDGWMDVLLLLRFPARDLDIVIGELLYSTASGQYVKRFRTTWLEAWAAGGMSFNLDGEPYAADRIRFDLIPGAIRMVLPDACPCLSPD